MEKNCNYCTGKYCAKKVSIFSMLKDVEIKDVVDLVITKNYKKGQTIFSEGDVSDKLFIINTGKIKIFKYTKESKEQILYILSEGDFVGDLNLLKKDSFEFSAEALEDVIMCTISKPDFDTILKKNPDMVLRLLENVHDRLVGLEKLVQTLSTKDIEARIASMLINFIQDFGCECNGEMELDIPLNREEMANFIGITRETLSRKLTGLQELGIIELNLSKKIVIKDMKRLKYMV